MRGIYVIFLIGLGFVAINICLYPPNKQFMLIIDFMNENYS